MMCRVVALLRSFRSKRGTLSDSSPTFSEPAAQAGVRHSIEHPEDYLKSNIDGFLNILEFVRIKQKIDRVIYASTVQFTVEICLLFQKHPFHIAIL